MSDAQASELRARVIELCPAGVAVRSEWWPVSALYVVTLVALDRDGKTWEVDWKSENDEQMVTASVRELLRMLSEVIGGDLVMPAAKVRLEVTPCGHGVSWRVVAAGHTLARGLAVDREHAERLAKEAMGEGWGRLFGDGAGGGAEAACIARWGVTCAR